MDEQLTEFATAATTEMSLKEIALQVLPSVCRELIKELPFELKRLLAVELASMPIDTLSDGELQSSYVKRKVAFILPSDFWELVSIRMIVWSKPVTDYILIDSDEYKLQHNPFTRAGKQNPVVAVSSERTGGDARLECFSVHNDDSQLIHSFWYVSFDNVPDDEVDGVRWPDELFNIVSKSLASELNVIKGRVDSGILRGDDTTNTITQHE